MRRRVLIAALLVSAVLILAGIAWLSRYSVYAVSSDASPAAFVFDHWTGELHYCTWRERYCEERIFR